MAWFCEDAGIVSWPRVSLMSSYIWLPGADTHAAVALVLTEWPSGHALVPSDAVQ